MEQKEYTKTNIGQLVADDFRAAEILKDAGIDFCCGGKKTLEEACNEKNIKPEIIGKKIQDLAFIPVDNSHNFKDWSLDFLADYIVHTHHKYVLKTLPELLFYTQKIAAVHGSHHKELLEVADLFEKINNELLQHMKNEEEVLFPAIKEVLKTNSQEARKTIQSEISRMTGEHEFAGGAMDRINEITHSYKVPADGCSTYNVTFKLLQQFEDDLHIHVHLENNILFPKALKL